MIISREVKEWLTDYKGLSDKQLKTFASSLHNNQDLIEALHELIDQQPNQQALDPVCHQLYDFYRSKDPDLAQFTLEFIPTLIWLYLSRLSQNDKKACGGLEACLLGIYNLEIVHADGRPKVQTFQIPSIAQPSIYHEPANLSTLALTESALNRYSKDHDEVWTSGPYPQQETINAQNRQSILSYLICTYSDSIASLSRESHEAFCLACTRIASTGFRAEDPANFPGTPTSHDSRSFINHVNGSSHHINGSADVDPRPRLVVTSSLMVNMLSAVYYIMFNGLCKSAKKALDAIHNRACFELLPDVQLVSNAILNSLNFNPSGQPEDGPMGISVALSPSTPTVTVSKAAITNASFRARKLPDDITVPADAVESAQKPLAIIDENSEINTSVTSTPKVKEERREGKDGKSGVKGLNLKIIGGKKSDKMKIGKRDSDTSTKGGGANVGDSDSSGSGYGKNQSKTAVDNIELTSITPLKRDRDRTTGSLSSNVDETVMSPSSSHDSDHSSLASMTKVRSGSLASSSGVLGQSHSKLSSRQSSTSITPSTASITDI